MSTSTLYTNPAVHAGAANSHSKLPRPPFDPALEHVRTAIPSESFQTLNTIRGHPYSFSLDSVLSRFPHLSHKEYTIPTPDPNYGQDDTITLSVFTPKSHTTPLPAIYNIHGGGQIAGDRFTGLEFVIAWYTENDTEVPLPAVHISVEYRLAPEHPAPAALHDCYNGLTWVAEHAEILNIDASKILVQGVSGGGPLAAACAIKARNHGSPALRGQLLSTPMLDYSGESVSARQFEDQGPWNGRTDRLAWGFVLGLEQPNSAEGEVATLGSRIKEKGDSVSELISPTEATDLAGVVPAFIDVGEAEVFRDGAVQYASLLWESGVSAELHVWPGAWHGFDMFAPDVPVSKAAVAAKKSWLRRILSE
ncbi:hypothetical protein N7517_010035 [Penicillium concentricum]|uniref:Alpha/beta hydrolase fold-3 domain-containing protein n=1 Tax=Penicillium concentricum TaxID=293559 RepID=A0A9W9RL13_9EURO|nr:uncharacterized protein N7517_010035 [Penicillium concentricum]KAJ5360844.1 hypothetical protein N7517_010035 [Penicillium concentricum]